VYDIDDRICYKKPMAMPQLPETPPHDNGTQLQPVITGNVAKGDFINFN
jgi:hypothetical protein